MLCSMHANVLLFACSVKGNVVFIDVFVHDAASCVTVQMVHVSCQLSDGASLFLARRKYVSAHGRHYNSPLYLAALCLA